MITGQADNQLYKTWFWGWKGVRIFFLHNLFFQVHIIYTLFMYSISQSIFCRWFFSRWGNTCNWIWMVFLKVVLLPFNCSFFFLSTQNQSCSRLQSYSNMVYYKLLGQLSVQFLEVNITCQWSNILCSWYNFLRIHAFVNAIVQHDNGMKESFSVYRDDYQARRQLFFGIKVYMHWHNWITSDILGYIPRDQNE